MNTQAISQNLVRIEVGIVFLLLSYYFGINVPPSATSIINILSYPAVCILIILRWKRVFYAATQEFSLLLLHALAVLSIIWSAAPDVTENEIKALCRVALFGVYLAARFSLKEQMKLLTVVLATAMITSFIAVLVFPSYGIHTADVLAGSWKGIFTFKNLFAYRGKYGGQFLMHNF